MPTNYTPATAKIITGVPYIDSVDLSASPDDAVNVPEGITNVNAKNSGWWKYTSSAEDSALSLNASYDGFESTIIPVVALWIEDPNNPGQYIQPSGLGIYPPTIRNVTPNPYDSDYNGYWLMFPVVTPDIVAGQVYYFQILNDSSPHVALTGNLRLTVKLAPKLLVPAGSLIIPDDTQPYPAVSISNVGDILRVFSELIATEIGAVLPTGEVCLVDQSGAWPLKVYSNQMVLVATTTAAEQPQYIQPGPTDKWYFITTAGGLVLSTIDTTGAIGGTTWTLAEFFTFTSFGISPDETIAYWADGDGVIHRHDLVNDLPLSDLVVITPDAFGEMNIDVDGNIIVEVEVIPREIRQYAPNGTLLQTYLVATTGYTIDHIRIYPYGTYFVVWEQSNVGTPLIGRWTYYNVSNGSILKGPFQLPLFNVTGNGPIESHPFAPSNSCPILFVTETIFVSSTPPVVGSGVYKMIPGKTHDTLYTTIPTTTDVKIP